MSSFQAGRTAAVLLFSLLLSFSCFGFEIEIEASPRVLNIEMQEVKEPPGLIIGGYNTLRLSGLTRDGEAFSGETEIRVIAVEPRGNGQ